MTANTQRTLGMWQLKHPGSSHTSSWVQTLSEPRRETTEAAGIGYQPAAKGSGPTPGCVNEVSAGPVPQQNREIRNLSLGPRQLYRGASAPTTVSVCESGSGLG